MIRSGKKIDRNRWFYAAMPVLLLSNDVAAQETVRPNLVFIMADQWRGQALGYKGIEPVITPNLDRLAREGVAFDEAVSSYPVSSPARAMLMTGQYPLANRVTGNCNSSTAPYGVELPETARCWSDVLKDKGYSTGYIGKWHLDAPYRPFVDTYNNRGKVAWNEWCPESRRHGFEHWIAYGTYDNHLRPMYWDTHAVRDSFYYVERWGPEYEADRAIEYLRNEWGERKGNTPFALVVSMNPPHTGYDLVPQKYKDLYKNTDIESICRNPAIPPRGTPMGNYYRRSIRDYYACMTGVDEQVGRIMQVLDELGLAENTIVIFTSDHGVSMGMHHEEGKNVFYEESMSIPLIVRWPNRVKPRRDTDLQIAFADLAPTMLSLMGFEKDIPAEMQTYNLAAQVLKKGKKGPAFQPYYRCEPSNLKNGFRGIRDKRYTFAVRFNDGKVGDIYLFDREKDPYQLDNIAGREDKLVLKYKRILKKWLLKTEDVLAENI